MLQVGDSPSIQATRLGDWVGGGVPAGLGKSGNAVPVVRSSSRTVLRGPSFLCRRLHPFGVVRHRAKWWFFFFIIIVELDQLDLDSQEVAFCLCIALLAVTEKKMRLLGLPVVNRQHPPSEYRCMR